MSYLIAQLIIDGPAEFFQMQTLYGLVLFWAAAKVIEIVGLEILDRMPNQRGPETLAEIQARKQPASPIPADRLRRATR